MTALATVAPATPRPLARAEAAKYSFEEMREIARAFAGSRLFKNAMSVEAAFTLVIAGQELGLPPIQAMTQIMMVEGKPTLSALLIGALIKRSGKYDYKVREITNDVCRLEFFEFGESVGFSEFTRKDAEAAGLAGKDVWKKYFRNMSLSRAMTNGARWYASEVFSGAVYTPEELGADVIVTEDGDMRLVGESKANGKKKDDEPPEDLTPALAASVAQVEAKKADALIDLGPPPTPAELSAKFTAAAFDPLKYTRLGQWVTDEWARIGDEGAQHIAERKRPVLSDAELRRAGALLDAVVKTKPAPEPETVAVEELAGLEKFEPEAPAAEQSEPETVAELQLVEAQQTLLPPEPPTPRPKPLNYDPDAPASRSQITQITLRRDRLLKRTDGPKWEMDNYRALMIDAMKVDSATKLTCAQADEFISTLQYQIDEKFEPYPVGESA